MQHLLSSDYVPGTLVGTRGIVTSEGRHRFCLLGAESLTGEIDSNHIITQVHVKIATLVLRIRSTWCSENVQRREMATWGAGEGSPEESHALSSSEAWGGVDEEHRGHVLMQSGVNPGFEGPEEYVLWKPSFRKSIHIFANFIKHMTMQFLQNA